MEDAGALGLLSVEAAAGLASEVEVLESGFESDLDLDSVAESELDELLLEA